MYLLTLLMLFLMVDCWKRPFKANAATVPPVSTPTCWSDDTRFIRVTFHECIEIISKDIDEGYDIDEPLKFSHDPSLRPDIQLPKYWNRVGVNCAVGIDMAPGLQGYDRTTLRDIKAAALAVAIECVIKPPHTGGFVQLGWHHKMGVLISGIRRTTNLALGNVTSTEQ